MDSLMLRRRAINLNLDSYITFADPVVAQMCIGAWGDGTGLTRRQAMFISDEQFRSVFNGSEKGITSFDELRFFSGITRIPIYAFSECDNLTSVILPSRVTLIQAAVFYECSSLNNINLINITNLANSVFKGATSLSAEIDIPRLTYFTVFECFAGSGIKKILSLGQITTLGHYDNFRDCSALTDVVLPSTLTSMGRQQFWNCTSLKTVKILATTPPSVGGANFYNCGDAKIYVPYSGDHSILAAYQNVWGQNSGALSNDVPRLAELDENGNIPE